MQGYWFDEQMSGKVGLNFRGRLNSFYFSEGRSWKRPKVSRCLEKNGGGKETGERCRQRSLMPDWPIFISSDVSEEGV